MHASWERQITKNGSLKGGDSLCPCLELSMWQWSVTATGKTSRITSDGIRETEHCMTLVLWLSILNSNL